MQAANASRSMPRNASRSRRSEREPRQRQGRTPPRATPAQPAAPFRRSAAPQPPRRPREADSEPADHSHLPAFLLRPVRDRVGAERPDSPIYRSFILLNYLGLHNSSHCCGGRRGPLWGISVVKVLDEHERTMAFAEVALGQIRSLRQTAIPRNYEIWYVYATGYNAPLNKIINETLARNGKLSEADLEQIYETYLSHLKTTDRIDKVGARVIGEIDDVMQLIDRRARHVRDLRRQPDRREREAVGRQESRADQGRRRNAGQIDARDARHQQGAGRAADAVEERDQQSAAEPGGDPRRNR